MVHAYPTHSSALALTNSRTLLLPAPRPASGHRHRRRTPSPGQRRFGRERCSDRCAHAHVEHISAEQKKSSAASVHCLLNAWTLVNTDVSRPAVVVSAVRSSLSPACSGVRVSDPVTAGPEIAVRNEGADSLGSAVIMELQSEIITCSTQRQYLIRL